jgi:hypothetical protein
MILTDLLIESWPIDRPIEYARNARMITHAAVDKVAASIQEFGFRQPIVVDKDHVIIVGHVRLRAAKKLGMMQVPVHVAANLTPAQVRAYRLMDNRSHEEVEWDIAMLGAELLELRDLEFNLVLTGFSGRELDSLLLDPALNEKADEAPPLPEVAVTKPGDLWLCGPHRVFCGDSTVESCALRARGAALGLAMPALMVTDPPYGVEYDPEWRVDVDGGGRHAVGKVANDDRVDWSPAWNLFGGDVAYVWHAGIYAAETAASLFAAAFQIRGQIIWRKQHFVMSRGAYHWQQSLAGTLSGRANRHTGRVTALKPPSGTSQT